MTINKLFNRLKGIFPIYPPVGAIIVSIVFSIGCVSNKRTATAQPEVVNAIPVSWVRSNRTERGYSVQYRLQTEDGQTATGVDTAKYALQAGL